MQLSQQLSHALDERSKKIVFNSYAKFYRYY